MKKLFVLLLLIFLTSTCWANPKDWFDAQADKIAHGLAGGVVAGLSYKHGADPAGQILNAAIVGGLKEGFDLTYAGKWDNWDWFATIVGGVLFVVL
ncbi:MAG: hypothetical protein KKA31_02445 [Candidatus Margulisbacteria bacterium]|nr:hypothetical protein [Candidatus Margulisiibacteriota bacterium]